MKHFFMTLAIVLAGVALTGCSGNGNGNGDASSDDIESKATEFVERIAEAAQKGDIEAVKQAQKEQQEWYDSFSEEEQFKVADAIREAQKAARQK